MTIRLTAAMADQLDDALDFWPPRRGPDGAADRDLDGEVRGIARVLRGMMEGVAGTAHPAPPAPTIDTVLRDGVRDAHHRDTRDDGRNIDAGRKRAVRGVHPPRT